jgi:hypothetical protein
VLIIFNTARSKEQIKESKRMHVLVTGATGFIGYHTVSALLEAGHSVRLGARNKKKLEAHTTGELVTLYHQGNIVAVHPRSHRTGGHTTLDEHMPIAHQKHQQWSPQRFENWARDIGISTETVVRQFLQSRKHPEQSYRICLGLLSLAKKYSPERLETACLRALATGINRLQGITSILSKGLDSQPLPETQPDLLAEIEHTNIRGNHYYH